jgi:hypothetical protein
MTLLDMDKICVCGDREMEHVDAMEQCFIPECDCKEFEESEASEKANRDFSPEQRKIIDRLVEEDKNTENFL